MKDRCQECKGDTCNEGSACSGAFAQSGNIYDTTMLTTCNCCDNCREKCHEEFMQSVEDGEQIISNLPH